MASEYFPHTIHWAKNTCPQIVVCPLYLLTIWFKESFIFKNCLWEVQTFAAPDLNFTLPSNWHTNTGLVPLNIIDIRFYRPQFTQEPFHPLFCHLKILVVLFSPGCVIFSWQFPLGPPVYCVEVGKSNLWILQTDFVPLDWTKFFFQMAHNSSLESTNLFAIWPAIKVDEDTWFIQLKSECCAFCTGMGKVWEDLFQTKNRLQYNYSFMCVVNLGPSGSLGDKL